MGALRVPMPPDPKSKGPTGLGTLFIVSPYTLLYDVYGYDKQTSSIRIR